MPRSYIRYFKYGGQELTGLSICAGHPLTLGIGLVLCFFLIGIIVLAYIAAGVDQIGLAVDRIVSVAGIHCSLKESHVIELAVPYSGVAISLAVEVVGIAVALGISDPLGSLLQTALLAGAEVHAGHLSVGASHLPESVYGVAVLIEQIGLCLAVLLKSLELGYQGLIIVTLSDTSVP